MAAVGLAVDGEAAAEAAAATAGATQLLEQLFPAILTAFRSEDAEVSGSLIPFLQARFLLCVFAAILASLLCFSNI